MSRDYAKWNRRSDLLRKAVLGVGDAHGALVTLEQEGHLPGDMVRPLLAAIQRQEEACMWLDRTMEAHQKAGRPEGMSTDDTGRGLSVGASSVRCPRCGVPGQPHPLPNVVGPGWWTCTAGHGDFQGHESKAE